MFSGSFMVVPIRAQTRMRAPRLLNDRYRLAREGEAITGTGHKGFEHNPKMPVVVGYRGVQAYCMMKGKHHTQHTQGRRRACKTNSWESSHFCSMCLSNIVILKKQSRSLLEKHEFFQQGTTAKLDGISKTSTSMLTM